MLGWSELRHIRAEAIWNGLVMIADGFLVAAAAHPWMWLLLGLFVVTASRKAWLNFARFVGGAFFRHQPGN